ncbi:MAG: LysE family translocator [Rhodospirillales bacterium]
MEQLSGFIIAAFALTGSPGPNTLSLAASGAAFGARRSVRYMFGLLVGMVIVMSVTATGVTGAVMAIPALAGGITAAAVAYFVYLAWRIATAPPLDGSEGERPAPNFAAGIAMSLANPKAYAAMAALFSGFVLIAGQPVADAGVKLAMLTATILLVNVAWLFAGAALTRLFRDPRASRAINILFAALLLLTVALAVT